MLYGYPGSGKTHFARQLAETLGAAHVQGDRIRYELFETPRYDKQENEVVAHLMEYMGEEFLHAGVSVVFDTNAMRFGQRRLLRDIARKTKAEPVLIWLQIDMESAFTRISKRDRRRIDDKYSNNLDRTSFDSYIGRMQNPKNEDYMVISGKHTFNTQRSAVVKKFYELGLIDAESASNNVIKPGLVNLVPTPTAGRVDMARRNIVIR
jgi:predicted kinase